MHGNRRNSGASPATKCPLSHWRSSPETSSVFQHNLKHAAFGGGGRRRMFTINCMVRVPDEQIGLVKQDIAGLARFWAECAYGEKMIATASERRMVHLEQRMANDGHLKELAAKARAEMPEPSRG